MIVKSYDLSETSIEELKSDLNNILEEEIKKESVPVIEPINELYGISPTVYSQINAALRAGKRHIILYGPPGTGKTTLAEYIAQELSSSDEYEMLTASSSWTSQDLIGGYQPIGGGRITFIPGAILRNFDKPIVIDELNRCPIDKVLGPLFSVLSGQASTLPYRFEVENENSPFHIIFPSEKEGPSENEWFPKKDWRLIATLNTVDKAQLGQISYALSRRFAWIKIGVPEDLNKFILNVLKREIESGKPNPLADMWSYVNRIRQIGGAPIIDCIKTITVLDPSIDIFSKPNDNYKNILLTVLSMYILPLLDGIRKREADEFINAISNAWELDEKLINRLIKEVNDIIA